MALSPKRWSNINSQFPFVSLTGIICKQSQLFICLRVIDLIDSPEFILLFPTDRLFLIFFDIDFALYLYGVAKYFYNYLFHIYLSVFFHIYLLVCFKHFIQSWYYLAVLKHFNIWSEAPHEKCPNTELFLVRIFLYSDRIQENTDQK